jgi:FkbM family methyltransferase
MPLARLFENVHSFEPNDFSFRVLRANVVLNGVTNVVLHNHGLFSHETVLSLAPPSQQEVELRMDAEGRFDGHASDNLGALVFSEEDTGRFRHDARTLDSFWLEDVAFIKVDVQGADGEVLMGALGTIERCRPVIVFEWEEHLSKSFAVTLATVRERIETLGYVVTVLRTHNEKQVDYVARPVTAAPTERA